MKASESGNVIFIIFIAIALFAGLAYAVTQGNRTGTDTMERSAARIHINEMKAYGAQIQKAIARLKTMKGCTIEQISFEHAEFADNENTNAPSDERCHIFSQNGGKVPFLTPPEDARIAASITGTDDWNQNSYFFNNDNAIQGLGSHPSEILLFVTLLKDGVCEEINNQQNISSHARASVDFSGYSHIFGVTGCYGDCAKQIFGDSAGDADLAGKDYGCVHETGSATAGKHFFYVLDQR